MDTFSIIANLAAGICLLLWGSFTVRSSVERVFSNSISSLLTASSNSAARTVLIGTASAICLQSATATILLATGLLNSGALTIYSALGVVLGADLGSAIAARILFLDLSVLPSIFIVLGMAVYLTAKLTRLKMFGRIGMGIGLMLLSLELIKAAVEPITTSSISSTWIMILESVPWISILIVAVATWFSHSSVAMILVIAVFAETGDLGPNVYIPMLVGANLGAGLIAIPLVFKTSLEARAVVVSNLVLRATLGIAILFSLDIWSGWLPLDTVGHGEMVIYLHVMYSVILVAIASPFLSRIADFSVSRLSSTGNGTVEYLTLNAGFGLDERNIKKPKAALSNAKREAFRLGDLTESYLSNSIEMFRANDESQIDDIVSFDDELNVRNRVLHTYLSRVRNSISDSAQEATLDEILHFSSSMEDIGDIIAHGLSRLAKKRLYRGVQFSKEGQAEITAAHEELLKLLRLVLCQFAEGNKGYEKQINKSASKVKKVYTQSLTSHRRRLSNQKTLSIGTSSIHQDVLRDLLTIAFRLEFLTDNDYRTPSTQ